MKAIVNASINQWWTKGSDRLRDSLRQVRFNGTPLIFKDYWPHHGFDKSNIYNLKAAALSYVINAGYKQILWADSSMWAIKNPQPIFDYLTKEGFYAESNGANAAQECSDKCLQYFGINRDQAEKIPMCSSGLIGFDLTNENGYNFAIDWIDSCKNGVWSGSRTHDNQSSDPRFLYHRQDQSAASLIISKLGLKMFPLGKFWNYDPTETNETIFKCRGM